MPKIAASERDAFYEKRRQEIVDAALDLWAREGFGTSSVSALASAAGISKGTFYLYFESKQALLEEVFQRHSLLPVAQELIRDLRELPLEEAVHQFVRSAWRHLDDRRELVMLLLSEAPTQQEQVRHIAQRVLAPANQLFAAHLEGFIPAEAKAGLSLVIAARSLLGLVLFTFISQEILGMGEVLPVREADITSTLASLFLHGVVGEAPAGSGPRSDFA